MGLVTGIAVYFVVWWITLFMVLPFGIERDKNVKEGNNPGAPVKHRLLIKFAINTVLALIIWLIIFLIDVFEIINISDL